MTVPTNVGADVNEINAMYPETWLGYNNDDELVRIRKLTVVGEKFERIIEISGVTDLDVAFWDKYRKWQQVK